MESTSQATCACFNTINTSSLTMQLRIPECPASLDDILNITHEVTEVWPRLQACTICFPKNGKSRAKDLLVAYEKVVGALEASADVFLSRRAQVTPAGKLINESLIGDNYCMRNIIPSAASNRPVSGRPMQMHAQIDIPSVFLGEFKLCQEQASELLGCVYRDVLRNLAMVLYEMRRVSWQTGWEDLNVLVARILHRVLKLLEHAK